jgi:uncharacterized protein
MNGAAQRAQLVAWREGEDPSTPVEVVETAVSIVGFQGDRVYKIKKAVHFPFVDLSTPAARHDACQREVELNRRFTADVYLGVVQVPPYQLVPTDHAVVMRRLPDNRRLAFLVEHGEHVTPCIDRIANLLASAHRTAATGGDIDDAASHATITHRWSVESVELGTYVSGEDAAAVARLGERYLSGRKALYDARVSHHRARDGHGDLLADDVFCLPDGPRLLDCLEFDDKLRYCDGLADAAFLAMDLERLHRPDLARTFLEKYRAGARDDWPTSLAHFYVAARARIRAKVAAIRGDLRTAADLVQLALSHLQRGRVRLVLVGGAPATGKTTLARELAAATGADLFSSDEIRKELAGRPIGEHTRDPLNGGIYSPEWTNRTYEELCSHARDALGNGRLVILDATWSSSEARTRARALAESTHADLVELCCTAPIEVAVARAERRTGSSPADASDADSSVAMAIARRFATWPEAHHIDTDAAQVLTVDAALTHVGLV